MPVGKTKDAGWQVGVSKTVPLARAEVYRYLLGPGLPLWLGVESLGAPGSPYAGRRARGEVRSMTENVRIRLTYQPDDGDRETTVQLGLRDAVRGTTIVFHQERMGSAQEREYARTHWAHVAEAIAKDLSAPTLTAQAEE